MKSVPLLAFAIMISGCTAAQGQLTSDVLTSACDVGSMLLAMPGALPICGDIAAIEQMVANRKTLAGATATPMTQAELYMMVKASGKYTPVKVSK